MKIAIIMGSKSDASVMQDATDILNYLEIQNESFIVSAHRTPEFMFEFANNAKKSGFSVIIAGAGGAAHLPGMVASLTILPVIGVPVNTTSLNGLDSLLSIVQMPGGIPVATVAINGAKNAGLLSARILALSDDKIAKKLEDYRAKIQKDALSAV